MWTSYELHLMYSFIAMTEFWQIYIPHSYSRVGSNCIHKNLSNYETDLPLWYKYMDVHYNQLMLFRYVVHKDVQWMQFRFLYASWRISEYKISIHLFTDLYHATHSGRYMLGRMMGDGKWLSPLLLCSLWLIANIHFDLQIVFVCLHITPSHYHHCANLSEDIELIKCLSDMFCQVCE